MQGGDIPELFSGIQTSTAISPTTVELTWGLNKKYSKYRVYRSDSNTYLKEETFQKTTVGSLTPMTSYQFSVTGVSPEGTEDGVGSFYTVTTLANFPGIKTSDVSLSGPTTVNIGWHKESDVVEYKIYQQKEGDSWNFTQSTYSVTAADHYQATKLLEGTRYCFYVVANYKDGTSEPDLTPILVNANSACITTSSDLTGLPTVAMNSVIPGNFPWFYVTAGASTMTTDVYDTASNLRVATRTGNGSLRAFTAQTSGFHEYYAIVSQVVSGVTKKAKLGLDIKDKNGLALTGGRIRGLQSLNSIYPRLVSGGKGVQRLGAQIVKGDFNCDGIPDLAVSAPKSTPYVHPGHVSEMGAVVVYYGEKYTPAGTTNILYRLKSDVAPSETAKAPFAQLIYYPVDYSNFRFGTKMATGNFNGDCKKFNPAAPLTSVTASCESLFALYGATANPTRLDDMSLIYTCDDLAVAINPSVGTSASAADRGGLFVIYGDPNNGLASGSGAANYGINEATCDPISGTCRAGRYSHSDTTNVYHFGKSLGVGDFNNDGFDDLVVGGTTKSGGNYYGRATVLRGSNQGILPTSSSYANVDVQAQTIGYSPAAVAMGSLGQAISESTADFAWAVAGVPGSRTCVNITTVPTIIPFRTTVFPTDSGFDFTKCADLAIGDPSRGSQRGSIVTCKAGFSATAAQDTLTQRIITSWSCLEHWPTGLEGGAKYGFSLLGVANQNGYPLTQIPPLTAPNITGALFVGAPWSAVPDLGSAGSNGTNAGKVFGYYVTPSTSGGIQTVLGSSGHTVQSNMTVPCDRQNENVGGSRCDNQMIYNGAPQAGELFGYALGSGFQNKIDPGELPKLLVSTPYRTIPGTSGNVTAGGAVFVFKGDQSVLGGNTQTRIDVTGTNGCSGSNCYYFSGGVNPFGPSLIYDRTATANANFGLAGAVGDNFEGDTSPSEIDIISTAPENSTPVEANGSIAIFQANNGFSPTEPVPTRNIISNVSKEINYRFDEAKIVGDLNGDGFADVVSRIKIGTTRVETVIFYGSANGLIVTPTPSTTPIGFGPKIIFSSSDSLLGINFFPIGDVNGDGFSDLFLVGGKASYIYYGSLTGVVSNTEPAVAPVGKNPLKFGLPNSNTDAIIFHSGVMMGDSTQTPPSYDVSNQAVTFGDFNNDGYSDFAVGLNKNYVLPSNVDVTNTGTAPFATSRNGRVVVIYGSPKGPQVGNTGYIRRITAIGSVLEADIVAKSPCQVDPNNSTLQLCKVQMLSSTETAVNFGWSLTGIKSFETSNKSDGLVISDPNNTSNDGAAFYYRGGLYGLDPISTNVQKLAPPTAGGGNNFGYTIIRAGDINGDGKEDLVVSAPAVTGGANNASGLYVYYGSNQGGIGQFFGTATVPVLNNRHTATTSPNPQLILPVDLVGNSTIQFGFGISSAGDFNGDGFTDIIVNVPKGDYELDVLKLQTGYSIIYFGSNLGLRSDTSVSVNPRCFGIGSTASTCEPYQFFLPDNTQYENTFISNSASGDINGDGYPDLLIGGFGRNHPSGQAYSSGVIYVLY